jgi:hypothetical protein
MLCQKLTGLENIYVALHIVNGKIKKIKKTKDGIKEIWRGIKITKVVYCKKL